MNIDTRIYGYIGDGYIVCCSCAAKEAKEAVAKDQGLDVDQLPECFDPNHEAYELAGLAPLGAYSGIHDRPCGETCEGCHGTIVEEDEDHGYGEACSSCGYLVPEYHHVIIDPHGRRTVVAKFQRESEAEEFILDQPLPERYAIVDIYTEEGFSVGVDLPYPGQVALPV